MKKLDLRNWLVWGLVGLGSLLMSDPARAQCAMCQASAESTRGGGAAFNLSTLFMLSVPYLLVVGVIGYVVYATRHPRRQGGPADSDPSAELDRG